jgi:hypothetical protein
LAAYNDFITVWWYDEEWPRLEQEMGAASGKRETNAPAESTYRAFLLRCWREAGAGPSGQATWRFSLVEPGNGETERGFASLEALLAHLRQELEGG